MSDISKIQVGETLYDVKDQTARDNFTNAKITAINDLSDDNHIPTAKSVYDYFNNQKTTSVDNGTNYNKLPTSGSVYNFINNKITSSISSSSTDSQIPTAKAVYDYIQNNSGGTANSTPSGIQINPNEYYTIQTMHLYATDMKEENMFDGMYKLSNYMGTNGVYKFTDLNTGKYEYAHPISVGYIMGMEAGLDNLEMYVLSTNIGIVYIIPQETTFMIPDEETEEVIETTLPAGFYVGVENEEFACTIQHMRKKENYLVQKKYCAKIDENALMGAFHKISDNIDHEGLFSVLSISLGVGEQMDLQYDCGGYFEPIENNYPEFTGFPAYALNSNALIHAEGGVPIAAIFDQSFTIPAGSMDNDEDIVISPGTYILLKDTIFGGWEMVKLQPKEAILDIDALFGSISEFGSFTETLNSQIFSTGSALLSLNHNDFSENIVNTETIYNMFNSAFEYGGNIQIRLHGTIGDIYTNMLCPTTIWKSGDTIGAAATLMLYTNNTWITYKLQIYCYSKNSFYIYCEGSAAQ